MFLQVERDGLAEDIADIRDLRVEIPLSRWSRLIKTIHSHRKLLGGVLLDGAHPKDQLSRAIASDRLVTELQRVLGDATVALVEAEALLLQPVSDPEES